MNKVFSEPIGIETYGDMVVLGRHMANKNLLVYERADTNTMELQQTAIHRIALTIIPKNSTPTNTITITNETAGYIDWHLEDFKKYAKLLMRMWDKPLRGRAAGKFNDALRDAGRLAMIGVQALAKQEFQYPVYMGPAFGTTMRTALEPVTVWLDITLGMVPGDNGKKKLSYHTRVYYAYYEGDGKVNKQYITEGEE